MSSNPNNQDGGKVAAAKAALSRSTSAASHTSNDSRASQVTQTTATEPSRASDTETVITNTVPEPTPEEQAKMADITSLIRRTRLTRTPSNKRGIDGEMKRTTTITSVPQHFPKGKKKVLWLYADDDKFHPVWAKAASFGYEILVNKGPRPEGDPMPQKMDLLEDDEIERTIVFWHDAKKDDVSKVLCAIKSLFNKTVLYVEDNPTRYDVPGWAPDPVAQGGEKGLRFGYFQGVPTNFVTLKTRTAAKEAVNLLLPKINAMSEEFNVPLASMVLEKDTTVYHFDVPNQWRIKSALERKRELFANLKRFGLLEGHCHLLKTWVPGNMKPSDLIQYSFYLTETAKKIVEQHNFEFELFFDSIKVRIGDEARPRTAYKGKKKNQRNNQGQPNQSGSRPQNSNSKANQGQKNKKDWLETQAKISKHIDEYKKLKADNATSIAGPGGYPPFDQLTEEGKKKWANKKQSVKRKITALNKAKQELLKAVDGDYTPRADRAKNIGELDSVTKKIATQEAVLAAMLAQKHKGETIKPNNSDVACMEDVAEADDPAPAEEAANEAGQPAAAPPAAE